MQNQNGRCPRRWDKTGKVVEKLLFRQYRVKMDGSGRVTLRNRKYLRKISPVCSDLRPFNIHDDLNKIDAIDNDRVDEIDPTIMSSSPPRSSPLQHRQHITFQPPLTQLPTPQTTEPPANDVVVTAPENESAPVEIRRSSRRKAPREIFHAQHSGKTYFYDNIGTD